MKKVPIVNMCFTFFTELMDSTVCMNNIFL